MKHFKNRIKQFAELYKDTKNRPVESHLEKFADYLDPRNNADPKQIKRQKHYDNLKEQHRKMENDYVSDFVSVSHKKDFNQNNQNDQNNLNSNLRQKTKVNYDNFDPMDPQKSHQQFENISNSNNSQQQQKNNYEYSFAKANEELKDQEKQQAKQDYYKEFQESLKKMENQQQYTKESEVKNNFNQNQNQQQNQHEQKQKQQQEEEETNLPEDENLSMAEKLRRKFMNPTPQKTELNTENEQDTNVTYQNAKIQSQTTSQVPFMITRSMKISLLEIGYTPDQIRSMRPADAHYALLEHASEKNNQKK